jgi:hypothetical protein
MVNRISRLFPKRRPPEDLAVFFAFLSLLQRQFAPRL